MKQIQIDRVNFRGIKLYILRDDLLGIFNGNKARKLEYLLNADLTRYTTLISYGSSQSNAMQALSIFCKEKNLEFKYVISHLSQNFTKNLTGNLKTALENNMHLYISEDRQNYARSLMNESSIFVKEGVAQAQAELGFITQAKQIMEFARHKGKIFDIFLPSGTGTSAAYLAKHIDFDVYTVPCVGDKFYLKEQIDQIVPNSKVKILNPPKKYHFANPKIELYEIYKDFLDETGIELDLIYDPVGILTLLKHKDNFKNSILYIHQGGLNGNESQILRYKHKFKIKDKKSIEDFKIQEDKAILKEKIKQIKGILEEIEKRKGIKLS